jgi:hypothetical protein
MSWNDPNRYDRDIARALATAGGHLSIGRGGFTLHSENSRLEGYDCDTVKAAAIRAGLPVIDSRSVPFTLVAQLAVKGPMIAVNTRRVRAHGTGFPTRRSRPSPRRTARREPMCSTSPKAKSTRRSSTRWRRDRWPICSTPGSTRCVHTVSERTSP